MEKIEVICSSTKRIKRKRKFISFRRTLVHTDKTKERNEDRDTLADHHHGDTSTDGPSLPNWLSFACMKQEINDRAEMRVVRARKPVDRPREIERNK